MTFTIAIFLLSLACIVALFALKHWETKRGRTLLPELRARGDEHALRIKDLALAARTDAERLFPKALAFGRLVVHEGALAFARTARLAERQAHRLADMVSHKRGFERRETRSEFLRKVSEGRQDTLDTTDGNGHNG